MKPILSAAQRRLGLFGLSAIIILWIYGTLIMALQRQAKRAAAEVRAARERLRAVEAVTGKEASLRQQHEQLDQAVRSLRKVLPAEEELPAVIELVSDLARQAQVKIQTIFPQRPARGPEGFAAAGGANAPARTSTMYQEILIQIDALAGYHQLGAFLGSVETGERPMEVRNLRIGANPKDSKRHTVKLLLRSYLVTAQRTGQQATGSGSGGA